MCGSGPSGRAPLFSPQRRGRSRPSRPLVSRLLLGFHPKLPAAPSPSRDGLAPWPDGLAGAMRVLSQLRVHSLLGPLGMPVAAIALRRARLKAAASVRTSVTPTSKETFDPSRGPHCVTKPALSKQGGVPPRSRRVSASGCFVSQHLAIQTQTPHMRSHGGRSAPSPRVRPLSPSPRPPRLQAHEQGCSPPVGAFTRPTSLTGRVPLREGERGRVRGAGWWRGPPCRLSGPGLAQQQHVVWRNA